ncbi:MAG: aconitate hydratase AcnA [Actinobacteria bacterium]|nr:MAG: aconitate hydratase AcnA [Actinomycetota bacterium]
MLGAYEPPIWETAVTHDPFSARQIIDTPLGDRVVYRLDALEHMGDIHSLPYSIKVLLESVLRNHDGRVVRDDDVTAVAQYDASKVGDTEIAYKPARVVLQDFTGVPAVVDLAAMRSAIVRMTGDESAAQKVNPQVQSDLVIDHSVQVDAFNTPDALGINEGFEFERNNERYEFLKWGQSAFDNFAVVPPATGIVHQVNLEYLAKVVWDENGALYPDSLVGTDSHTTMINGLGVVGWGVGGIEAEAVMVGQPIYMLLPEVVGFKLVGALPDGATATDLVLRVTEMLRAHGVVGKFVEFYGSGLGEMPVANRATLANMAPEYGATVGFFPVDGLTLDYLRLSGRSEELIATVEQYYKMQGLWRDDSREIKYSSTVQLDMSTVVPSLAGPKRPQDRIALTDMKQQWHIDLEGQLRPDGGGSGEATGVHYNGATFDLSDGDVVIAAITSCTNTSNPEVMVAAGLVARRAREKGLTRKPWVKTSLAPGSKVVTEYLEKADLLKDLEAVGFFTVGYGCTTCIGNSGPIPDPISAAINGSDLVATSVLSGNRNFEGRISPDVRANYLASPPLVVAYALAGTVDIDLATEPLGTDEEGNDVYLADLWPTQAEILETVASSVSREQFVKEYGAVYDGSAMWRNIKTSGGALYGWDESSTYVQEPPFFMDLDSDPTPIAPIMGARVLLKLGDSITTDHISPAGAIGSDTPAGRFLTESGVEKRMFNSYGSRRGNDRVMTRGTFANIRVRNQLAPGTEGGWTKDFTDGEVRSVYEASLNYREAGTPLVVLGGTDYGMGSSRDWAAKGTFLLGVKAVIASSYERIHRSNLVMMGVLPLEFPTGENADSLGLDGTESFDVVVDDSLTPGHDIEVRATKPDGTTMSFTATARVDTPIEVDYLRHGGILHMVLREMASD